MSRTFRADDRRVFLPGPKARDVNSHVAELPPTFEVRRLGSHWVVVGPSGVFVIGRCHDGLDQAIETVGALAHGIREALSERMPFAPFVDAVVVADGVHTGAPCTVVPVDLLVRALTSGGAGLDPTSLAQVQHHLPHVLRSLGDAPPRPLDRA